MNYLTRSLALLAIVFWASAAVLVLELHRLPTFQLLAFTSSISLVLTCVSLTLSRRWKAVADQKKLLPKAAPLVIINQLAYVVAFRCAPAAQVDLINYLWPSMIILLSGGLSGRITPYLVILTGAGGVFVALDPDALQWTYSLGYLAAFIAAVSWTAYSLVLKRHQVPPEFLSLVVGLGAPLYWIIHSVSAELSVQIGYLEGIWLLIYGGGVYVLAYLCWGYAIKHGSLGELSALSYLIPLLSILGLGLCGFAELSARIVIATVLILMAALIPMAANLRDKYKWIIEKRLPIPVRSS